MSGCSVLDDAIAYLDQDRAIVAVVPWCGSLVTIATAAKRKDLTSEQTAMATGPNQSLRAAFLISGIEVLRRMLDDTFNVTG